MSDPNLAEPSVTDSAPPLNFTDAAAHKVGQLIEQEGNSALKLRVYVQGGGCSGFQYGFTFDEEIQEGDTEIENARRHAARRSDERSVPHGGRDRLPRGFVGRAVHHSQSECDRRPAVAARHSPSELHALAAAALPESKLAATDPAGVMAAVDLGSNSFHMVVARADQGHPSIIDRLREMVRLASGLESATAISTNASQERALACLRRFGQRLRDMQAHQVRVVGTNTLRRARNGDAFLAAAEKALGHPVEVISGIEEARLIYLGVSHHTDTAEGGSNLVVDIGGGSTELIIGEGYEPKYLESLSIGCVGLSQAHFDDGRLSEKRFARARLAVRLELRPVAAAFRERGWSRAIGSSGTVRAACDVAHELGLVETGVSLEALESIIATMIEARRIDDLELPGLGPDRAPVFAGGVAIFAEIMSTLKIEHMEISGGALREGLLYDMLGRLHDEDARERSIQAMQRRYHVDMEQAAARRGDGCGAVRAGRARLAARRQALSSAARVGCAPARSRARHRPRALSPPRRLSARERGHAGLREARAEAARRARDLSPPQARRSVPCRGSRRIGAEPLFKLIVLLRLAVLLNRSRSADELPQIGLTPGNDLLEVRFPEGWLDRNPLTAADLEQEQSWLQARGFELKVGGASGT